MKILIVGNGAIVWQIKTCKKMLPQFQLFQIEMPKFSSIEKVMEWKKAIWAKIKRMAKKYRNIVVFIPEKMSTKWGELFLPKDIRFDMAILIGTGFELALAHADIIKVIKSKSIVDATKELLAALKEVL
jgi:hypothetical protein